MDIQIFLQGILLGTLFLSTVYIIGVIWRVEGELDISYKFLSASVFVLLMAEMLRIFAPVFFTDAELFSDILRAIFGITFLISIFLVRDVVRREDGEIHSTKKAL